MKNKEKKIARAKKLILSEFNEVNFSVINLEKLERLGYIIAFGSEGKMKFVCQKDMTKYNWDHQEFVISHDDEDFPKLEFGMFSGTIKNIYDSKYFGEIQEESESYNRAGEISPTDKKINWK